MPQHTPPFYPDPVPLVGLDGGGMDSFCLDISLDPLLLVSSLATIHLPAALVRLHRRHQRLAIFSNRTVYA